MNELHPILHTNGSKQTGFVLIVALILLLVLTILGLAAAQSTSIQERMAGNARDKDLAFQAAEAGLRAAENCVNTGMAICTNFSANANGVYTFNADIPPPPSTNLNPLWKVPNFWGNAAYVLSYQTVIGASLPSVASQPEFIIEKMPPVAAPGSNIGMQQFGSGSPSVQLYRITSYGTGGDSSATAMLQVTYQP